MKKINIQLPYKAKKRITTASMKVLPANKASSPIKLNKEKIMNESLDSSHKKRKVQYSPSSRNNFQSLKDKIFSPSEFMPTKNESKNRKMIIELSKKLLEYTSTLFKSNEHVKVQKNKGSTKYLPEANKITHKKTLILDLDETLVHSALKPFSIKSDLVLSIPFEDKTQTVHVLKRPNVDKFLEKVSKLYEVVIFTAGIQNYASPLLNKLDPNHYISYRLYREHCTQCNKLYIKDLNLIGRELKDTIIIDNNPISYAFNKDNGIPILTWMTNQNDDELMKMIPLLEMLSTVEDVREIIKNVVSGGVINYAKVNALINSKKEQKDIKSTKKNALVIEEDKIEPLAYLHNKIHIGSPITNFITRKKDLIENNNNSSVTKHSNYFIRKERKIRDKIRDQFNLNYETTKNTTLFDERITQITEPHSRSKNHISSVDFYGKAYEKENTINDNIILPSNNCRSSSASLQTQKQRRSSSKHLFTSSSLNESYANNDSSEQSYSYRSPNQIHLTSYGSTFKGVSNTAFLKKYGFSFITPPNQRRLKFGLGSNNRGKYQQKINHFTTQTATISLNDPGYFPTMKSNKKISFSSLSKSNRNLSNKIRQRQSHSNLTFNA